MSFDPETLIGLLPGIYRTRDSQIAQNLQRRLDPTEAAELLDLRALPSPNVDERDRTVELEAKAALCTLDADEVVELAGLEALASPTPAEQARTAQLRAKANRGPLRALLEAFSGEIAVMEQSLDQLYDDLFVETCADWVIPYIGDLLGSEPLHQLGAQRGLARAEVAHTIALRRRKGTAAVLEQLARDLTGWNARAVEYFRLLITTQFMNHVRKDHFSTASVRERDALQWVGTAFDSFSHTVDVRRISSGVGRYNVPNVGIFLWSVDAHRLSRSPTVPEPHDDPDSLRHRFSPLGHDMALYTKPEAEERITHLAEPINVPAPLDRELMHRDLQRSEGKDRSLYYGAGRSLVLFAGGDPVPLADVCVCNLSDAGSGWAHDAPAGKIAVDPELGRLAVASDYSPAGPISATFRYGQFGDIGGGEYSVGSMPQPPDELVRVPDDHASIQAAIDSLAGSGVVEITDSGRYRESLSIAAGEDKALEVRAAAGRRPCIQLTAPWDLSGGPRSRITLRGLLVFGDAIAVSGDDNTLRWLDIEHCTLVPGLRLLPDGSPEQPGLSGLVVNPSGVQVHLVRSISAAVRFDPGSQLRLGGSIVDSCSVDGVALAAPGPDIDPGGHLICEAATIVGTSTCRLLEASNSIFVGTVRSTLRQAGCVRFSYLPSDSVTPRQFRCQPRLGPPPAHPQFTTLRYGSPAYCQLSRRTPASIREGADDESEMGAFHFVYQPQREANLVTRLDEYLRVGLRAGIFYES